MEEDGADVSDGKIETFAELKAAVEQGGEYTLLGNIRLQEDFTLSGVTLKSWTDSSVSIHTNGHTLSMEEGVTLDGVTVDIRGDDDLTKRDIFNMYGGKITGVKNNEAVDLLFGTFNMYGGEITGNQGSLGSVYLGGWRIGGTLISSTFNMYGGTISGNTTNRRWGGGVYMACGTFNMYGGTISNNTAQVDRYGNAGCGGGVYVEDGVFNMSGGDILGNVAESSRGEEADYEPGYGGGVYLCDESSFTMTGGTIAGNRADTGAGIFCENGTDTTVTLSGSSLRIEDPVFVLPSVGEDDSLYPALFVEKLNLPADHPVLIEFPGLMRDELENAEDVPEDMDPVAYYASIFLNDSIDAITAENQHMFRLVFTRDGVVTERYSPVKGADGKWTYGPEIVLEPEEPEGSEPDGEEGPVFIPSEPIADGWHTYSSGTMYYQGGKRTRGWAEIDGKTFYFDSTGYMAAGWVEFDEGWRYFAEDGGMVTGWLQLGSVWYYLDPGTGIMYDDGPATIGKSTYYFHDWGGMASDWWYEAEDGWYYFGGSGAMKAASWLEWNGNWYYLTETGKMAVNTDVGGYAVNADGIWVK